jgi:hypothetical protein
MFGTRLVYIFVSGLRQSDEMMESEYFNNLRFLNFFPEMYIRVA